MGITTPGDNLVNVILEELTHTATITAGGDASLTLQPSNPYIYRIKAIETIINPPGGTSAGNNTLIIYYYDGTKNINLAKIHI